MCVCAYVRTHAQRAPKPPPTRNTFSNISAVLQARSSESAQPGSGGSILLARLSWSSHQAPVAAHMVMYVVTIALFKKN